MYLSFPPTKTSTFFDHPFKPGKPSGTKVRIQVTFFEAMEVDKQVYHLLNWKGATDSINCPAKIKVYYYVDALHGKHQTSI
jgi:hypothetical protein